MDCMDCDWRKPVIDTPTSLRTNACLRIRAVPGVIPFWQAGGEGCPQWLPWQSPEERAALDARTVADMMQRRRSGLDRRVQSDRRSADRRQGDRRAR